MSVNRKRPIGKKAQARVAAQRRTRHAASKAVRELGRSFTPRRTNRRDRES